MQTKAQISSFNHPTVLKIEVSELSIKRGIGFDWPQPIGNIDYPENTQSPSNFHNNSGISKEENTLMV